MQSHDRPSLVPNRAIFRHDYPFDPTYGHDLAALLAVAAPEEPAVPPPGQFAIYNALAGSRELFVLQAGHFDHPGLAAEDGRLRDALAYFFNR